MCESVLGMANCLVFFVNGKKIIEKDPDPECTLLSYIREKLYLCGTKLGCAEGGCGACTVMVSKINRQNGKVRHFSVNACLIPVCALHGTAVTTVEGIGSIQTRLHPVQERIAKAHGSQCGFCTPGFVMSMYALLRNLPKPSMKDLEIAFQGNLCRCTGYRPIIEGYRTFTKEFECAMGENCCKNQPNGCSNGLVENKLFEPNEFTPYDPSQEPIFPPELKITDILDKHSVKFQGPRVKWYRPTSLKELLDIKAKYPEAKIVVGNTEVGVEVKFKRFLYSVIVHPSQINELNTIQVTNDGVKVGAAVPLSEIEEILNDLIKSEPEYETRLYTAIVKMMHYFAGKQVRNVACLAGNIMTGSPISDLNPIFLSMGIELEVASSNRGTRRVKIDEDFFTGYRKNVIASDEVLVYIHLPKTNRNQFVVAYKQAKRRDDDIAIVNASFNVHFKAGTDIVDDIKIAFGGMAPITAAASKTCKTLKGLAWNENLVEVATTQIAEEMPLAVDAPGGMTSYRRCLTISLFFKAFLAISEKLNEQIPKRRQLSDREKSGSEVFTSLEPKSSQLFEKAIQHQSITDPIGYPEVAVSAYKQATGEAMYTDDIPKFKNELYLGLVLSTKSHAKILSIDETEALKLPGVHAFFSAKDLNQKQNTVGPYIHDEELFASKMVYTQGQTIGSIVAENQALAQHAARLVKVTYEDVSPMILTIEDAIAHKSYFKGYPKTISKGDVDKAFKTAEHVIEGSCRIGGQEHFYLETHVTLAIPKDSEELDVISSNQSLSLTQSLISHVLSIPSSKIIVRAKRMGGGFGGKELRSAMSALPVAFAAYKLKRPVRCMLDRDEDMMSTGTRHPFLFKYKIACEIGGKITGMEIECYCNAGYSADSSFVVLQNAILNIDCGYYVPNVRITGFVCKTNIPSCTAFRGFGEPQATFFAENMIRHVAQVTSKSPEEIAFINLYKEGDMTFYNQKLENCTLKRCWTECLANAKFLEKQREIQKFNEYNRWRKRGIAIVPVKHGITLYRMLNKAGALVHIYSDGSVLLTHGGVEMGQGLYTKLSQVASRVLGIPMNKIYTNETATNQIANMPSTVASLGSDVGGMAVMNACNILNERLVPYKKEYPKEKWEFWISKACDDLVCLSAIGYYKNYKNDYDFDTNTGTPFNYFTMGAGCSVVEIDCLTGDHQVLRTDIVMDVGSSLNPAIDIGQIEGAFMQGYGLYTLEEMIYSPTGTIYSRGPGMYKIPSISDIPAEFNVSILTGAPNPRAIYSSKAIGEPPLALAVSIFFAIKEAISAARKDQNVSPYFEMIAPATAERIRMACEDKFSNMVEVKHQESGTKGWNIIL